MPKLDQKLSFRLVRYIDCGFSDELKNDCAQLSLPIFYPHMLPPVDKATAQFAYWYLIIQGVFL
jgi:hypothetical protein